MAVLGTALALVVWLWTYYLPGYLGGLLLVPRAEGLARQGVTLLIAFSTFPLLVFLASAAATSSLTPEFMLIAATVVNLTGFAVLKVRGRPSDPGTGSKDVMVLLGMTLCSALFIAASMRFLDLRDSMSAVHHCLYVIVMHAIGNDPSRSIPLFDGFSDGTMHFLIHHANDMFNGLGVHFYEQRLGNTAIIAPMVSLFGTAGWFLSSLFATAATGVWVTLAARESGARPLPSLLAASVFIWGAHLFCGYVINENMFAVALVAFLLWASLRRDLDLGWIVLMGITAGHLIGVRHTSSLFLPAIALAVLWQDSPLRQRAVHLLAGVAVCLLTMTPWLYVNYIMLGEWVTHPKVLGDSAERIVDNSFLGYGFRFRSLNWPFIDAVSRSPSNPFPTFLWIPLWAGRCFGQVSLALSTMGAAMQLRGEGRNSRNLWILVAFIVPHTLAIGWLEDMDWERITYAAPGLVPVGVWLALGMDSLGNSLRRTRTIITAAVLTAMVSGSAFALRSAEFRVDTRMVEPEHRSTDFGADPGVEALKRDLTAFSPLPALPFFHGENFEHLWQAFGAVVPEATLTMSGLPIYRSGQVAILSGNDLNEARTYEFVLEGVPLRTAEAPVRTGGGGQSLLTLRIAAKQIRVSVTRDAGRYRVVASTIDGSEVVRDFTIRLTPWNQPALSVTVEFDGSPLPDLRTLEYDGWVGDSATPALIVTNYGAETIDMIRVPYTVESMGEPTRCGTFVFISDVDYEWIETFLPIGGHQVSWEGETSGHLVIPRNPLATHILLFSSPYCHDHIPQYGDRYAVVEVPATGDASLVFRLDRMWRWKKWGS